MKNIGNIIRKYIENISDKYRKYIYILKLRGGAYINPVAGRKRHGQIYTVGGTHTRIRKGKVH